MTRSTSRHRSKRPAPARDKHVPVLALNGAACPPEAARAWTITAATMLGLFTLAAIVVIARIHTIGDYFTETDFYGAYAEGARLIQHGRLDPARYGVIGPATRSCSRLVGFVVRDLFLAAELLSIAVGRVHGVAVVPAAPPPRRRAPGRGAAAVPAHQRRLLPLRLLGHHRRVRDRAPGRRAVPAARRAGGAVRAAARRGGLPRGARVPHPLQRRDAAAGRAGRDRSLGAHRHGARGRAAAVFAAGFLAPVVPWVLLLARARRQLSASSSTTTSPTRCSRARTASPGTTTRGTCSRSSRRCGT